MKTGDIIIVLDGSWGLFYPGNGSVGPANGIGGTGRRFRVLLTGVMLPSTEQYRVNDTMLCEECAPEKILFTKATYCKVVDRSPNVQDETEIVIPSGTKKVVFRLLD